MTFYDEILKIFVEEKTKFGQIRTQSGVRYAGSASEEGTLVTEEDFWAPFRFDIRVVLTSGNVTVIRVKDMTATSIVGHLKLEATDGFEDTPQRINPAHIVAWRFVT
jgi:hypothetical protein